jgi:hypothetical protein
MFLPVTPQPAVSIPEIVCIPKIVSIPNNVSTGKVASGISRVPHACDRGICMVRYAVALIDSYSGEWTRTGNRYSILIARMLREPSRSG